jgi:hypothetical protein
MDREILVYVDLDGAPARCGGGGGRTRDKNLIRRAPLSSMTRAGWKIRRNPPWNQPGNSTRRTCGFPFRRDRFSPFPPKPALFRHAGKHPLFKDGDLARRPGAVARHGACLQSLENLRRVLGDVVVRP